MFLGGRVELAGGPVWWRGAVSEVDVDYEYGSRPPLVVTRAITKLAAEFEKADAGVECKLPDRVTSVSRQGLSWSLVDPNDILDKGRSGIYEIDLAIRSVGAAKVRSAVFSPEYPPPKRISFERLPEPTS